MLNLAGKRAHFQRNRCSTSPVLPLIFGGVCSMGHQRQILVNHAVAELEGIHLPGGDEHRAAYALLHHGMG